MKNAVGKWVHVPRWSCSAIHFKVMVVSFRRRLAILIFRRSPLRVVDKSRTVHFKRGSSSLRMRRALGNF
jgi:hypothetical protein